VSLSAERRLLLEYAEEGIAADPEGRAYREDIGDVVYDITEPNLAIAFRRLGRSRILLLAFRFLDDPR
jgi:hypothetical protein